MKLLTAMLTGNHCDKLLGIMNGKNFVKFYFTVTLKRYLRYLSILRLQEETIDLELDPNKPGTYDLGLMRGKS